MSIEIKNNIKKGIVWTIINSIGNKIVNIFSQLVLAWILLPSDFGKIGLMFTITSFITILQNFGLTDVLIKKEKSFDLFFQNSTSILTILSIITFVLCLLGGVIGGILYDDNEIMYLIFIFSLSIFPNTFNVLPDAKLRINLQFKTLSLIQIYSSIATNLLTIVFALLHFGIYSFVIPIVIISYTQYFYCLKLSNLKFNISFKLSKWRVIVVNSFYGFANSFNQRVIQQSDVLILGLIATKSVVGIYYMAFTFSIQAIGFVVGSIVPVLYPTLNKIPKNQFEEQKNTLLIILKYLSFVGMPFAFWQILATKPLILIFLSDKWGDTIQLTEILSFAIGFKVISSIWEVALRLKGDFKLQAKYSSYNTLLFIALIVPFTFFLKEKGAAIAVTLHNVSSIFLIVMSFKKYNISARAVLQPIIKYFLIGFVTVLLFFYLRENVEMSLYLNFVFSVFVYPIFYMLVIFSYDKATVLNLKRLVFERKRVKTI
ncbi:oligosaccharide flippase family protein [Flavobacterium sp. NG2]|uniref:oligosaccharide flippase family protein n=1 Tax=Flavobacterium sp. NG2 TaxID=3097547 RepID=UPI002A802CBB|nr:oligosaccharide flippase family protein [Flavobacterium sp. NG2]WPR71650.1 oligosaccharide flippase family protein [Flavobacterium sp. NG2]